MTQEVPAVYERDGKHYDKDTFNFTAPSDSIIESERGKKIEDNEFEFQVAISDSEAQSICDARNEKVKDAADKWTLLNFVNATLFANARQNAYQKVLNTHKPSTMAPEDMRERMIRDYQRYRNVNLETATAAVDALLS